MLSYATVEPRTLEILRAIMSVAIFSQTRLVGGTSLALQLGHRKSIDLDFFGCIKSENEEIKDVLRDIGQLSVIKESRHIKIYMVDDIKIDFVDYVYKWIDAPGKSSVRCPLKPKRFYPLKIFNNAPSKSLDRWGYYYFSLFPSVCRHLPDTFSV